MMHYPENSVLQTIITLSHWLQNML